MKIQTKLNPRVVVAGGGNGTTRQNVVSCFAICLRLGRLLPTNLPRHRGQFGVDWSEALRASANGKVEVMG